ncbi:MAG: hypothetical protein ACOZCL_06285 [Bacillota bacterium]
MIYILTGISAFIFLFLFDVYTIRGWIYRKYICGCIGAALILFSAIMLAIVSKKAVLPLSLRLTAIVLCILSVFLLVYSLFIELPFKTTYAQKKHSSILIDTGTYALCRHPGVLWFAFIFFFYYFATGAELVIAGGLIWTSLDVLHVYLQEKLFFLKMFPSYADYMSYTPMLIPTKSSIERCILTLQKRRNEDDKTGRNAKA